MKRLILMRHAKSDWSSGGSDHDRPLNARGRAAADALGTWLRAQEVFPDQVLCSSATRTRETYQRLALEVEESTQVAFERRLYLAEPSGILTALREAKGQTVLIVGHNPGIGVAAQEVLHQRPQHPRFDAYPSGATLVADFDISDWPQASWGKAIARHFVVPRDL